MNAASIDGQPHYRAARCAVLGADRDADLGLHITREPEEAVEPESVPGSMTMLRSLIEQRHWRPFKAFRVQFLKAALELAEREGDPEFGRLDVSERQVQRWLEGARPRPYSCRVLEHLFGLPIDELMAPAATDDAPANDATGSPFAALLKDLRLRRGYSLRRLGGLVHYSHGYLRELETGEKQPTAAVAAALDRALDAAGQLARRVADLDVGHAVPGGRLGVDSAAVAAGSGGPTAHARGAAQTRAAAGPAVVLVHISAGAQVTVVCHDGAPGRVAVLAGTVRVLIDASGTDPTSHAPTLIEAPMVAGGARVYSLAERRAR